MNIKELERRTGITKQNIRFYERKGLLNPVRNEGNNYREYVEEDVKTLEVVKILRKLDMSIEDIHRILQKEVELDVAVKEHLDVLREKQSQLEACIHVCQKLGGISLEELDTGKVLKEMEDEEQNQGWPLASLHTLSHISNSFARHGTVRLCPSTQAEVGGWLESHLVCIVKPSQK